MKKIGVVFPGQGSQKVGMGKKLYENFDYIKSIYKKADEVLGFSITELCFNGPEDELRKTFNTQPALLLTSYAIWNVLKEKTDIKPAFVAGHSLGEWTALLVSGFFTFQEALMLTRKRGLFMEEACPKGKGGMVALIGPDMDKVIPVLEEISRDDYVCVPANLNAHDQVVLSGDINALKEAVERLKGVGYKKAVFLNVSGPFHSPLMKAAADRLNEELNNIQAKELQIPVISNVDAEPTYDKEKIKDKLFRQMFSPVLWEDSVKRMVKEGVEVFLEVGPQRVLTNLIKRIAPDVSCIGIEELEDIESIRGVIA
ncbi:MAG TPA: ACP S-malonyltransferase [Syntrophorhabdaceae bacterium]|nr:ACP S-malonyltransferase [Syntrophorhabdaceae bacterium]HPP05984.1 ACP S-malonyltransferase [Syntrophorhabdaceae bacterium]